MVSMQSRIPCFPSLIIANTLFMSNELKFPKNCRSGNDVAIEQSLPITPSAKENVPSASS